MHLPAKEARSRTSQLRRCIAESIHLQHPRFHHHRTLQDAVKISSSVQKLSSRRKMNFTGIKDVRDKCRRRGAPVEGEAILISNPITATNLLCLAPSGASIVLLYAEPVYQDLAVTPNEMHVMLAINLLFYCHRHTPRRLRACRCRIPVAQE
jgi:hypothetical protein